MQYKSKLFGFVSILVLFLTFGVYAQDSWSETVQVTTTHVETHPSQGDVRIIEGASATLLSTEDGISVRMKTDELEEGHVYTFWVVIMNNPEACASSPCTPNDVLGNSEGVMSEATWGDSMLYTADARMEFSAYVPAGDVNEAWFGHGLTNPLGAEIHLVINDHGEAIPELVASMLNTYRGGCTDESLPPPFPESATSDGEPGENACRLIQDAIFIQGQ